MQRGIVFGWAPTLSPYYANIFFMPHYSSLYQAPKTVHLIPLYALICTIPFTQKILMLSIPCERDIFKGKVMEMYKNFIKMYRRTFARNSNLSDYLSPLAIS